MKLFYSPASPFVRKVLVAADEVGLRDRIELVAAVLSPTSPDASLSAVNPLGKIPALVTDEGGVLFDSHVIVDYLDGLHAGRKLIPPSGPRRHEVLRREALADGIADAAVLVRYETYLRPEALRWPAWIEGQLTKVKQGLAMLDDEAATWPEELDLGQIATACAVGYLDFRKPGGVDLMEGHARLRQVVQRLGERPSFAKTVPHP